MATVASNSLEDIALKIGENVPDSGVVELLEALRQKLIAQIVDGEFDPRSKLTLEQVTRLQRLVTRRTTETYAMILRRLAKAMRQRVTAVDEIWRHAAGGKTGVDDTLSELPTTLLIRGGYVKEWVTRQRDAMLARYRTAAMLGVQEGLEVLGLVSKLSNAPASALRASGQIVKPALDQLRTLERTLTTTCDALATLNYARANSSRFVGVAANATLDGQTSDVCTHRHHMAWTLDGQPLKAEGYVEADAPFTLPAWHWNCRVQLVPISR